MHVLSQICCLARRRRRWDLNRMKSLDDNRKPCFTSPNDCYVVSDPLDDNADECGPSLRMKSQRNREREHLFWQTLISFNRF